MKKLKLALSVVIITILNITLQAQEPDPLPDDGSGQYLDQVPIAGEIYFLIIALCVGAFILYKRHRTLAKRLPRK